MKKTLRHWAIAVVGAAAALAFTSCAYDPYYTSVGGSYGTGYGEGYGYGGSGFSTSLFVSTGDPRWGYDPDCYSYYDYHRRCYYDPYLHGYYPVGYRPPIVYGVPHPYGYRHGYCPPPRYIHDGNIPNYRNREYSYRNSNYGWAKQVRQSPDRGGAYDQHPRVGSRSYSSSPSPYTRMDEPRQYSREYSRQSGGRAVPMPSPRQEIRSPQPGRLPSSYNSPVTRAPHMRGDQMRSDQFTRQGPIIRQSPPQNIQREQFGGRRQIQYAPQREGKQNRKEEKRGGIRSLGEG